jgi:hypothetical protein
MARSTTVSARQRPAGVIALVTAAKRGAPDARRLLHHDEYRSLKVLHKPLGDDLRHELVGVVDSLAALIAQGERESVGDVIGGGGREAFGRVGHQGSVAEPRERSKNKTGRRGDLAAVFNGEPLPHIA